MPLTQRSPARRPCPQAGIERLGVPPELVADLLSLVGDSSDNGDKDSGGIRGSSQ